MRPKAEEPVNMLRILQSDSVQSDIYEANCALFHSPVDDRYVGKCLAELQATIRLQSAVNKDYKNEYATVTGVVHAVDNSDTPTDKVGLFHKRKLIYCGPTVQAIGSQPRIVFEFHEDDGNNHPMETIYYMLPENITELEIHPSDNLIDIISMHAKGLRQLLSSPAFLQASIDDQHRTLTRIIHMFNKDTQAYLGELHEVKTNRFMIYQEDMPRSLADSLSDQSSTDPSDQFIPYGKYMGCIIPEAGNLSPGFNHLLLGINNQPDKHFEKIDDFPLSSGTLCMVFEDDENPANKITYVIPIDAITNIFVPENPEQP